MNVISQKKNNSLFYFENCKKKKQKQKTKNKTKNPKKTNILGRSQNLVCNFTYTTYICGNELVCFCMLREMT